MKFRHIKYAFVAVFAAAVMTFFGTNSNPAQAAEIPEYRLQISPAKQDIGELKPGQTYTGTFMVQNTGQKPFNFDVGVSPYSVSDENYSPNYDTPSKYTDIANWTTFSQTDGYVEPNKEVEITYTIKVPRDVPAGGQYAVLTVSTTGEEDTAGNTGVVAVRRVGMLVYAEVEGATRKTGEIVENNVAGILFNPPVTATSIVENTGNVHISAEYTLQVFPLFGDEELYTNEESPARLTILPETRRLNTLTWQGTPRLGIFRVRQTIKMLGETSVKTKIVIVCPIWLLLIILTFIFCVIAWIVLKIRNRHQR